MTTRGKIVIGLLIVVALYFGINKVVSSGSVFKKADTQSVLLNSIELPTAASNGNRANVAVPLAALPSTTPAEKGTPITWEEWPGTPKWPVCWPTAARAPPKARPWPPTDSTSRLCAKTT